MDAPADTARKFSWPVVVTMGEICVLASLCFWVGRQADRIDNVSVQMSNIQTQMALMSQSDAKSDIATLKEHTANEDRQLMDLKDYVGRRLDRVELKLDAKPNR